MNPGVWSEWTRQCPVSGRILWHIGMPRFDMLVPKVSDSMKAELQDKLVN